MVLEQLLGPVKRHFLRSVSQSCDSSCVCPYKADQQPRLFLLQITIFCLGLGIYFMNVRKRDVNCER